MTEHSTSESFIVRIYRVDTEDPRKLTGLAEAMDGSGKRESFNDMDELAAILNRSVNRPRKRRKKTAGSGGRAASDSTGSEQQGGYDDGHAR